MLQQTRVETVVPFYERFLDRFPSVSALAAAREDEVLELWSGLGYYRRARSLHRAAGDMVREHGGEVPRSEEELRALPGIGRYTAGAIRSIAFGEEAPIVDGNVVRVVSRIFRIPDAPGADRERVWELASRLVRGSRPGDLNQGLMELGARICTPTSPACDACPVRRRCDARRHREVDRYPHPPERRDRRAAARRAIREVRVHVGVVERRGRVLLVRRPPTGLWAGLWDLPAWESPRARPAAPELEAGIEAAAGIGVTLEGARGKRTWVLSHRRLDVREWSFGADPGRVRAPGPHRWVRTDLLAGLGVSALVREILSG